MRKLMRNKKYLVRSALTAAILSTSVSHAATYQAFLVPTTDRGLNSTATAIGENGNVAVSVTGIASNTTSLFAPANIPIDLTLVNFEDTTLTTLLSDVDAVMNGNISDEDYLVLAQYVLTNNPTTNAAIFTAERQRVGRFESYLGDQNGVAALPIFDVIDVDIGDFSRSVNSVVNHVVNDDFYLGESSAPYTKVDFVEEDGDERRFVVRQFAERGFVVLNGQTVELVPEGDAGGGWSTAQGINSNLLVAGSMSINALESTQAAADNCEDEDARGDVPQELCITVIGDNLANDLLTASAFRDGFPGVFDANEEQSGYNIRGALWQLDNEGNIVSTTTLGLLNTPADDAFFDGFSRAFAVNDQGVAAGESLDLINGEENRPSTFAAVFIDGEAIGITDVNEFDISTAVDINNNNIATGHARMNINGRSVFKMFTYNVDTQAITFPEDFFSSSDVRAEAINDAGMVVGDAESDITTTQIRRRSGFLFNPADSTFLNINDLLECDSPFDVIRATDINENGEISATALVRQNIRNPLNLEEADVTPGDPTQEDVTVALRLVPIPGGTIDDCSAVEGGGDDMNLERRGASLGFGILFLSLFGINRRLFRRNAN
ncbi:DUF3466 family protein [Alteromonadaceae bacterium M269]|nr:DUF3466 family protein [Alteromonadaceae bacterium M269]